MVDMKTSMVEILVDREIEADVLELLKDNWRSWASKNDVDFSDASYWREEMLPWIEWLRDVPDTLVALKKEFDEMNVGGGDDGIFTLLDYIQAYTGTANLDEKSTTPLTRVLRHLQNGVQYLFGSGIGQRRLKSAHVGLFEDVETAKFMLTMKDSRPGVDRNIILRSAALSGNAPLVKVLLDDPRVDPTDKDDEAMQNAIMEGNHEVVGVLLVDGRASVETAVSAFKRWVALRADNPRAASETHRTTGLRLIGMMLSTDDRVEDVASLLTLCSDLPPPQSATDSVVSL